MAKNTPTSVKAPDAAKMAASTVSAIKPSITPEKTSTSNQIPHKTKGAPVPLPCTNTTSRLLELPAELRNRIYGLALTDDYMVEIQPGVLRKIALTQTCRQIRNETAGMFYACNTFLIRVKPALVEIGAHWLRSVGADAPLITKVSIRVENHVVPLPPTSQPDNRALPALNRWRVLSTRHFDAQQSTANNDALTLNHALETADDNGLRRDAVEICDFGGLPSLYRWWVLQVLHILCVDRGGHVPVR